MARKNAWTPEQLALLGTDTDKKVAELLNKKPATVTKARLTHGVPAFDQSKSVQHKWTDDEIQMLGNVPDIEIADRLGISRNAVVNARNMRGIASHNKTRAIMRGEYPRIPITIRLPSDLIEKLRAAGSVTAQIESAIRNFLKHP